MRYKISVHAAAIWGVAGFFSALSSFYYAKNLMIVLSIIFLFSGLTVFARLKLGRHTPNESWIGALLGFVYFYFGFSIFA
jgi:membrane-associated phospholipid phosphatase